MNGRTRGRGRRSQTESAQSRNVGPGSCCLAARIVLLLVLSFVRTPPIGLRFETGSGPRIRHGVGGASDAEAVEAREVAVAVEGGQARQIDRHAQRLALHRPKHGSTRPRVALFQEVADRSILVEAEPLRHVAPCPPFEGGVEGPHRFRQCLRYRDEAARFVDRPHEPRCPFAPYETERPAGLAIHVDATIGIGATIRIDAPIRTGLGTLGRVLIGAVDLP